MQKNDSTNDLKLASYFCFALFNKNQISKEQTLSNDLVSIVPVMKIGNGIFKMLFSLLIINVTNNDTIFCIFIKMVWYNNGLILS